MATSKNMNCIVCPDDYAWLRSNSNGTISIKAKDGSALAFVAVPRSDFMEALKSIGIETTTSTTEPTRAAPNGPQKYRGNGNHGWEAVTPDTTRLRVPGGWLYRTFKALTFVPTPDVVGYEI